MTKNRHHPLALLAVLVAATAGCGGAALDDNAAEPAATPALVSCRLAAGQIVCDGLFETCVTTVATRQRCLVQAPDLEPGRGLELMRHGAVFDDRLGDYYQGWQVRFDGGKHVDVFVGQAPGGPEEHALYPIVDSSTRGGS
jgi:hypothetical protein